MRGYWWRGREYVNLGDELASIIPQRLFGHALEHSPLSGAQVLSVGSVLGWLWENDIKRDSSSKLEVLGSGFMSFDTSPTSLDYLSINSVRGYLSKNRLGILDNWNVQVGDPGILASQIAGISSSKRRHSIGVILHHSKCDDKKIIESFAHLPVHFIDIRTDDLDAFCNEMMSCDLILSQSLHGLIIADSFGIPNAWLFLGYTHSGADFKYFDYFSTVDRSFRKRVRGIPANMDAILPHIFVSDPSVVKSLQDQVLTAYKKVFA